MNKIDYYNKLKKMINDGIQNGNYKGTEDKTLDSLKVF